MLDITSQFQPWRDVIFMRNGIAHAYASFLFGASTPTTAAAAAYVIAKNKPKYYYFTSLGRVHSSGDILSALKYQLRQSRVVSANDVYSIEPKPQTTANLDDLPLEYALSVSKYASLNENDQLKMALLETCRTWKLILRCHWLDDPDGETDDDVVFDPMRPIDSWITDACNYNIIRLVPF